MLDCAAEAIPFFETVGDDRSLGRTWLLTGFVYGGVLCREAERVTAAERALIHYRLAGWPASTCLGEIAIGLYQGPTRVPAAIERLEELLDHEVTDRSGEANLLVFLGGLEAQRGDFQRGRELAERALESYRALGQAAVITFYSAPVLAEIASMSGNLSEAERLQRETCAALEEAHDWSHLSSRAADLAETLVRQGQMAEAAEYAAVARDRGASDDLETQIGWRCPLARSVVHSDPAMAELLVREAVTLAESTDNPNLKGRAFLAMGEMLEAIGKDAEAAAAYDSARTALPGEGKPCRLGRDSGSIGSHRLTEKSDGVRAAGSVQRSRV
jgi:tetratricopeptide (TPR) repeat protein